jgi:transcriptional regulator with XRE-family HTH domain
MQREADWIIEALARDSTKTKTGLARALNVDKSAISRLLRGERRLKFEEAQRAAEYLGVGPGAPGGFAESAPDFASEPRPEKDEALAPLYPIAVGKDGLWRLDRRAAIERKPRAPQFAGAGLVFGFYVPDAAMAPRFRIGEIAWVNPARPAAAGEDALIVPVEDGATDIPVFLCALEAISETSLVAVQYGAANPPSFPRKRWRALHVFGRE